VAACMPSMGLRGGKSVPVWSALVERRNHEQTNSAHSLHIWAILATAQNSRLGKIRTGP
jgi:hypothetical protein